MIELQLIEQVSYYDNLIETKRDYENRLAESEELIDNYIELIKIDEKNLIQNESEDLQLFFELKEKDESAIDSIQKRMGDALYEIAAFNYLIIYKIENQSGDSKVIENYLQVDKDLKIINLSKNREDMHPAPGGFPGYLSWM